MEPTLKMSEELRVLKLCDTSETTLAKMSSSTWPINYAALFFHLIPSSLPFS